MSSAVAAPPSPASCVVCMAAAAVFCRNDKAFLCASCDFTIHGCNAVAGRHIRVPLCECCTAAAATVYCRADAAALCDGCDADVHAGNPLAAGHEVVPIEERMAEGAASAAVTAHKAVDAAETAESNSTSAPGGSSSHVHLGACQHGRIPAAPVESSSSQLPATTACMLTAAGWASAPPAQQAGQPPLASPANSSDAVVPVLGALDIAAAASGEAPFMFDPAPVVAAVRKSLERRSLDFLRSSFDLMGPSRDSLLAGKSVAWGKELEAAELDHTWLDRLDEGFDFSDILAQGAQDADGLVPTMLQQDTAPALQPAAAAHTPPPLARVSSSSSSLQRAFSLDDAFMPVYPDAAAFSTSFLNASAAVAVAAASQVLQPPPPQAVPLQPPPQQLQRIQPGTAPAAPAGYARVQPQAQHPQLTQGVPGFSGLQPVDLRHSAAQLTAAQMSYGVVTPAQAALNREARVQRYREKRKNRKFEKTIRYASRKAYAEVRPRIKGRFAKREEMEAAGAAAAADAAA